MLDAPAFLYRPFCFLILAACIGPAPDAASETNKYRLSWRDDPATTMVIGWNQVSGHEPIVHYGKRDRGTDHEAYKQQKGPDVVRHYRGMANHFARLTGLEPDTAYYFVIRDSEGVSARMGFKTAPDDDAPFTFIIGGDTRSNAEPRINGNKMIAKLRPLFVAHGGDYMNTGSEDEWDQWFDEWQFTRSEDGRMYPLLPAHGNHENADLQMIHYLFDTPHPDMYFALDVGDYFRLYTLNTELTWQPVAWYTQAAWLEKDLEQNADYTWKVANYHRPMRAHTSKKSEGVPMITFWAQLFYDHGIDLVTESDTHMVKRTYPVKPSDGPEAYESFERDDENGIVFIGEGSWGAPTRPADDDKPWTMASDSFWQFKWIHVYPGHMEIRSVRLDNEPTIEPVSDRFSARVPEGLDLWVPDSGAVLYLPYLEGVEKGFNPE